MMPEIRWGAPSATSEAIIVPSGSGTGNPWTHTVTAGTSARLLTSLRGRKSEGVKKGDSVTIQVNIYSTTPRFPTSRGGSMTTFLNILKGWLRKKNIDIGKAAGSGGKSQMDLSPRS